MDDTHFSTGKYDPETYWDARAAQSHGDSLGAVCVFKNTKVENRCADRVQRHVMSMALKKTRIDLSNKYVLEYGCGVGRWVSFFQQFGCLWNGVDIAGEMLRIARERHEDTPFRKIDGIGIPYSEGSFDLVYSVCNASVGIGETPPMN